MTQAETGSAELLEPFEGAVLTALRRRLLSWFRKSGRPLPWRQTADPYRIWISEIMLQQTTVKAVVPYFERFLAAFPSVDSLASASEEEVLKKWEGLGYYSRGRNLRRAAIEICDRWDGRFPEDVADLESLPGIGRYTAGAIASFAFDRPAPIVEANTLRLYARLLGFDGDPYQRAGQNLLWEFATRLQPARRAGDVNQALMELGALICRPAEPDCASCPVKVHCRAATAGLQGEIPRPRQRPQPTQVTEVTVAVRRKGKFLLYRRPPGGRWAGLWDFPRFPLLEGESPSVDDAAKLPAWLTKQIQREFGVAVDVEGRWAKMSHTVTRYRIQLHCFVAAYRSGRLLRKVETEWVEPGAFVDYPLSVTGRKFANVVRKRTLLK